MTLKALQKYEWIYYPLSVTNYPQRKRDRLHSGMSTMNILHAYRHWEDDLWISSKVSDVAVEWDTLLCGTSLAHSQGHAQDGISTEFS